MVLRLSRRRGCPSGLRSVVLSLSGAVPQPFATLRSWSRGASRLRCRIAQSRRGASAFAALCSLPSGPLAFTALAEGLRGLRPSQRWVRASGARPQTPVAPRLKRRVLSTCRCLHLRFSLSAGLEEECARSAPLAEETPPLGQSAFIIGGSRKCSFPLVTRIFSRTPSLNASCPSRLMG